MNLKLLFLCILLLLIFNGCRVRTQETINVSVSDLPDYRYYGRYRVDPYIEVAMKLQAMGKEKAIRKLLDWGQGDLDYYRQVVLLCRMLFVPQGSSLFQRPSLGAPSFFGGTTEKDWPLEPIEIIDGVPFLIVNGYTIGGQSLPAREYVMYCYQLCDWNPYQYQMKTQAQKQEALKKLLTSAKWKAPIPREFFIEQVK